MKALEGLKIWQEVAESGVGSRLGFHFGNGFLEVGSKVKPQYRFGTRQRVVAVIITADFGRSVIRGWMSTDCAA